MDCLAHEGARFANAFVATPVCSPSRATFFTGLHGTRHGICDYISSGPGFEGDAGLGIPVELTTWPEVLQQNGYTTALIGKWHLGSKPEFHPNRNGFDHYFGFLGPTTQTMDVLIERNGKEEQTKGYLDDRLMDEAIEFINKNRFDPFALVLATRAPHLPFGPVPEVDSEVYKDLDPSVPCVPGNHIPQVVQLTRDYYSSVHSLDRNLGRLLGSLDELDLADNTIVVYTSDHGYNIGHHGLQEKGNAWSIAGGVRGPMRPNMFEESVRVPLLIRWPGVIQPGTVIDELVSNVDLYSSILGMLGIDVPEEVDHDGADFSRLLQGENVPWRDAVFGQYNLHNFSLAFMRMIRTPRWKLVRYYLTNNLDELYDLEADPHESNNLYYKNGFRFNPDSRPIIEKLEKRLLEWQLSIKDPIIRPEYTPLEPLNRRKGRPGRPE